MANAIGCPLGPEVGLPAKVQAYQHGLMIWLDLQADASNIDSKSWVITLAGTTADRTRFDDSGLTWQDGQVAPSGAFAWVYQNVYTDADRLGAPGSALGSSDAAIELFEHGTMVWLRNPPGANQNQPMIYVIQSNLVDSSSGSFQVVPDKSFQ